MPPLVSTAIGRLPQQHLHDFPLDLDDLCGHKNKTFSTTGATTTFPSFERSDDDRACMKGLGNSRSEYDKGHKQQQRESGGLSAEELRNGLFILNHLCPLPNGMQMSEDFITTFVSGSDVCGATTPDSSRIHYQYSLGRLQEKVSQLTLATSGFECGSKPEKQKKPDSEVDMKSEALSENMQRNEGNTQSLNRLKRDSIMASCYDEYIIPAHLKSSVLLPPWLLSNMQGKCQSEGRAAVSSVSKIAGCHRSDPVSERVFDPCQDAECIAASQHTIFRNDKGLSLEEGTDSMGNADTEISKTKFFCCELFEPNKSVDGENDSNCECQPKGKRNRRCLHDNANTGIQKCRQCAKEEWSQLAKKLMFCITEENAISRLCEAHADAVRNGMNCISCCSSTNASDLDSILLHRTKVTAIPRVSAAIVASIREKLLVLSSKHHLICSEEDIPTRLPSPNGDVEHVMTKFDCTSCCCERLRFGVSSPDDFILFLGEFLSRTWNDMGRPCDVLLHLLRSVKLIVQDAMKCYWCCRRTAVTAWKVISKLRAAVSALCYTENDGEVVRCSGLCNIYVQQCLEEFLLTSLLCLRWVRFGYIKSVDDPLFELVNLSTHLILCSESSITLRELAADVLVLCYVSSAHDSGHHTELQLKGISSALGEAYNGDYPYSKRLLDVWISQGVEQINLRISLSCWCRSIIRKLIECVNQREKFAAVAAVEIGASLACYTLTNFQKEDHGIMCERYEGFPRSRRGRKICDRMDEDRLGSRAHQGTGISRWNKSVHTDKQEDTDDRNMDVGLDLKTAQLRAIELVVEEALAFVFGDLVMHPFNCPSPLPLHFHATEVLHLLVLVLRCFPRLNKCKKSVNKNIREEKLYKRLFEQLNALCTKFYGDLHEVHESYLVCWSNAVDSTGTCIDFSFKRVEQIFCGLSVLLPVIILTDDVMNNAKEDNENESMQHFAKMFSVLTDIFYWTAQVGIRILVGGSTGGSLKNKEVSSEGGLGAYRCFSKALILLNVAASESQNLMLKLQQRIQSPERNDPKNPITDCGRNLLDVLRISTISLVKTLYLFPGTWDQHQQLVDAVLVSSHTATAMISSFLNNGTDLIRGTISYSLLNNIGLVASSGTAKWLSWGSVCPVEVETLDIRNAGAQFGFDDSKVVSKLVCSLAALCVDNLVSRINHTLCKEPEVITLQFRETALEHLNELITNRITGNVCQILEKLTEYHGSDILSFTDENSLPASSVLYKSHQNEWWIHYGDAHIESMSRLVLSWVCAYSTIIDSYCLIMHPKANAKKVGEINHDVSDIRNEMFGSNFLKIISSSMENQVEVLSRVMHYSVSAVFHIEILRNVLHFSTGHDAVETDGGISAFKKNFVCKRCLNTDESEGADVDICEHVIMRQNPLNVLRMSVDALRLLWISLNNHAKSLWGIKGKWEQKHVRGEYAESTAASEHLKTSNCRKPKEPIMLHIQSRVTWKQLLSCSIYLPSTRRQIFELVFAILEFSENIHGNILVGEESCKEAEDHISCHVCRKIPQILVSSIKLLVNELLAFVGLQSLKAEEDLGDKSIGKRGFSVPGEIEWLDGVDDSYKFIEILHKLNKIPICFISASLVSLAKDCDTHIAEAVENRGIYKEMNEEKYTKLSKPFPTNGVAPTSLTTSGETFRMRLESLSLGIEKRILDLIDARSGRVDPSFMAISESCVLCHGHTDCLDE